MATVSETALRFGKIGLLIDDAYLAASRTARALYLNDELPEFWLHHRCIEEAIPSLEALFDDSQGSVPRLVVVDRMLPLRIHEPPVYWDESAHGGEALAKTFRELIKRLDAQRSARHQLLLLTSFPPSVPHGLVWQARSHEPLYRLRTQPDATAPELWRCASANGTRSIQTIAAELHRPDTFKLLVTGAGMSMSSGPGYPGMPKNSWLLTWAAHDTIRELRPNSASMPEPVWPQGPTVNESRFELAPTPSDLGEPELERLMNELIEQGKIMDDANGFNALFSDGAHNKTLQPAFRRHFRRAVLRYDTGITQRHWLAAQLPFHAIATTNFDGFHQRARAHVWGHQRWHKYNQLASVLSAYGDASSNEDNLAFTRNDFRERLRSIREQLDLQAKHATVTTIVVVGYAFRDAELGPVLKALAAGSDSRLFWIGPEADRVKSGDEEAPVGLCHELLKSDKLATVSMRAADFFHDLYGEFVRQGRKT